MIDQQTQEFSQLFMKSRDEFFDKMQELSVDRPKLQKAIAITQSVAKLSELVIEGVKLRSRKKKRIFSQRNRKPKRKYKATKAQKLFVNALQTRMELIQLQAIKSMPIGLSKGSDHEGGFMQVSDNGSERIHFLNGKVSTNGIF